MNVISKELGMLQSVSKNGYATDVTSSEGYKPGGESLLLGVDGSLKIKSVKIIMKLIEKYRLKLGN